MNVRIGEGQSGGGVAIIRLVFDLVAAHGEVTQDNVTIYVE